MGYGVYSVLFPFCLLLAVYSDPSAAQAHQHVAIPPLSVFRYGMFVSPLQYTFMHAISLQALYGYEWRHIFVRVRFTHQCAAQVLKLLKAG
jgi:hypothetical protein